ncbi:MAG: RsmE family RNA methyltransferase [Verrucomicrobiota bacterium]
MQVEVALKSDESHHLLNVLRVRVGQEIEVFNGEGGEGLAEVAGAGKGSIALRMLERTLCERPRVAVTLVQAVTREQKMDLVVQKAVELGALSIVPVLTEHGVVRLKPGDESSKKTGRWSQIALHAAKQCGAAWLTRISPVQRLADYLAARPAYDLFLVCALTDDARPLRDVLAGARDRKLGTIGVLVGPEGDFSADELRAIRAAGALPVSLGGTTLRSETAAVYALSVLRYELM